MTPRARNTDPQTSHLAAASVDDLTYKQYAVLVCLRNAGPCLDEELVNMYILAASADVLPVQSESGIRTRRHELVEQGLVRSVSSRPNVRGRIATVWAAL